MTEESLRQIIEQIDPDGKLSPDKVEDFIAAVKDKENPAATVSSLEEQLKLQMTQESDWRKRASIAAKIISINLE